MEQTTKKNIKIYIVLAMMCLLLTSVINIVSAVDIDLQDGSTGRNVITWQNTFTIDKSGDNIQLEYRPKYTVKYYNGKDDNMDWFLTSTPKVPTDSEVSPSTYIIKIPRNLGFLNRSIELSDLLYFDNDPSFASDYRTSNSSSGQIWSYLSYLDYSLTTDYDAYLNYCYDDSSESGLTRTSLEIIASQCIATFNTSSDFQTQINKLIQEKSDFEKSSEIYFSENKGLRESVSKLQNQTDTLTAERDKYKRDYDSCSSDLIRANAQQTSCKQTEEDLKNANDSKTGTMLISFLVGLGVYHFLFAKKKRGGPTEQSEAGSYADSPRYRETKNPIDDDIPYDNLED